MQKLLFIRPESLSVSINTDTRCEEPDHCVDVERHQLHFEYSDITIVLSLRTSSFVLSSCNVSILLEH